MFVSSDVAFVINSDKKINVERVNYLVTAISVNLIGSDCFKRAIKSSRWRSQQLKRIIYLILHIFHKYSFQSIHLFLTFTNSSNKIKNLTQNIRSPLLVAFNLLINAELFLTNELFIFFHAFC